MQAPDQDKVVVITGGSKGIGLATAKQFLAQGCRVINLSRSDPEMPGLIHISADISQVDWIDHCAGRLLQAVANPSRLHVIHCAGLLRKDAIGDLEAADLHQVFQVNVVAMIQLVKLLLPKMQAGSSIIPLGSTLSEKAVANSCSYVISKHAVVGMMRSACQDLAGSGIHTVCICPGFTDTEMLRAHVGNDQKVLDAIASGVTFNRLIEPKEIASTIEFATRTPSLNGAVLHASLGQIES